MATNKYDPIQSFLITNDKSTVRLSLSKIARMVGGLPAEANRSQFWANTDHHNSRRRVWLDVGYQAFLEKNKASVRFVRQSEETKAEKNSKERQALAIVTSQMAVQSAFKRWHKALLKTAEFEGSVGWLPSEGIAFSAYNNAPDGKLREKVALSTDPDGANWVLQINKPKSPSTENGLSAIGEDPQGNLFLLRQGVLQANNLSVRIQADEFEELSSTPAVAVTLNGEIAKRRWFIVTAVSDDDAQMRQSTARFVELCARIRDPDLIEAKLAKADADELEDRFGMDEMGGSSTFWSRGGTRVMRRRHGEVWQALKAKLAEGGKSLNKPSHARGYETDGEVTGAEYDLLLEIKTGCSAADVYTGVGQLQVYPKLLQRLANHRKVLLLPDNPSDELVAALADLDIELHVYEICDIENWTSAVFPRKFLESCGLVER